MTCNKMEQRVLIKDQNVCSPLLDLQSAKAPELVSYTVTVNNCKKDGSEKNDGKKRKCCKRAIFCVSLNVHHHFKDNSHHQT